MKKWKSKLDKVERIETRPPRRIIEEKPHVPASPPLTSTQEEVEVEQEETQSPVPPPIRKVLEKKSKAQLSTNIAHYYPFISAKASIAFDKRIKGKQPIKERALDLKSYGTDKVIHDIIKSLGWT